MGRTLQMGSQLRIFIPYHHHNSIFKTIFIFSHFIVISSRHASRLPCSQANTGHPALYLPFFPVFLQVVLVLFLTVFLSGIYPNAVKHSWVRFLTNSTFLLYLITKVFKQLLCSSAVKTSPYMFGLCHDYHWNVSTMATLATKASGCCRDIAVIGR